MKRLLARLAKLSNAVPILTIILGALAGFGLTKTWFGVSTETVVVTLVTLLAAELLIERLGILADIRENFLGDGGRFSVRLFPRTHQSYRHFHDFVAGASEVVVVGIDLGFMSTTSAYFLKTALRDGLNLRLLMFDPQAPEAVVRLTNNHDERNALNVVVHNHAEVAKHTIETLRGFCSEEGCRGSVEIRARQDIPALSLTFVDPKKWTASVRVEVKFYKRNHGEVPVLELDRTSPWYDDLVAQYCERLWNDSPILFKSGAPNPEFPHKGDQSSGRLALEPEAEAAPQQRGRKK